MPMNAFNFLTGDRIREPGNGLTMMLDKGMGPMAVIDLMEIAGDYVDLAKFGWGTSALGDRELIKEKVQTYLSYGVIPYPGGTLFEIAYIQNKLEEFFYEAHDLGFEAVEISDGTVEIPGEDREEVIVQAKENDFLVITEVGKKDPQKDSQLNLQQRIQLVNFDLQAGADKVLMEAREGGKGIGVYDGEGNVKQDELEILIKETPIDDLIWEAPLKNQQAYFILKFGSNVNLGNIAPEEITALETMRQGLRGDTLGKVNL
jgi:phosphosulfolactate synthase